MSKGESTPGVGDVAREQPATLRAQAAGEPQCLPQAVVRRTVPEPHRHDLPLSGSVAECKPLIDIRQADLVASRSSGKQI